MKKWYLLRDAEYSTDFDFFMENQVLLSSKTKLNVDSSADQYEKRGYKVTTNTTKKITGEKVVTKTVDVYDVMSRLESFTFGEIFTSDPTEQIEKLRKIHNDLINDKYGNGTMVD